MLNCQQSSTSGHIDLEVGVSSRGTVFLIKVKEGKLEFQSLLRKQLFTCSIVFTIFLLRLCAISTQRKQKQTRKETSDIYCSFVFLFCLRMWTWTVLQFLSFDKKWRFFNTEINVTNMDVIPVLTIKVTHLKSFPYVFPATIWLSIT